MQIRTKIFSLTLLTVVLLDLIFATIIFFWQISIYKDRAIELYQTTSDSTIQQIDSQLASMNSVSLSISYSNYIKSNFKGSFDKNDSSNIQNAQFLSEFVFSIIGPQLNIPQVYIFSFEDGCFGHGIDNGFSPYKSEDMDWYSQTIAKSGSKYITQPRTDSRIAAKNNFDGQLDYISLTRIFYNSQNVPQGFVEIMQRSDRIFSSLNQPLENGIIQRVLSDDGSVIYSSDNSLQQEDIPIQALNTTLSYSDYGEYIVVFSPSDQSDFLLVTIVPKTALVPDYRQLFGVLIIASTLVLLAMLPVVYSVSRSVSNPIRKLYESIKHTNLDSITTEKFEDIGTNILEIVELDQMLRKMKFKISHSMDEILMVREQELQARMLALQAQMNPHFLYNSLATLSAMASENMTEDIESFCDDLSSLMRYISTDKQSLVPIETELEFTHMYVRCMQIRFPDLVFKEEIPIELLEEKIPKLSIQLLVENAIKSVTTKSGRRIVTVRGELDSSGFLISIEDNGSGFPEDVLKDINSKIIKIKATKILPSLQLEGMGILNVYIRLLLSFDKKSVFEIQNLEPSGAMVRFGVKEGSAYEKI